MLSTSQKVPPLSILFLSFSLLVLIQWPASCLIQHVSLSLGILLNETLFVSGLAFLIAWRSKISFKRWFVFKKPFPRALFSTVVMTLALVVIVDYLTFLSEKVWAPPVYVEEMLDKIMRINSLADGLWRFVLICLTPAFCEEIYFRGLFQNTLTTHRGKMFGLWITATAFALIHGIPWVWHLYFILGFYLSWLMMVSGNLWFPILAHLINNSWTFIQHTLGKKIQAGGTWQGTDSLILGICVVVFALASFQFVEIHSIFQKKRPKE